MAELPQAKLAQEVRQGLLLADTIRRLLRAEKALLLMGGYVGDDRLSDILREIQEDGQP